MGRSMRCSTRRHPVSSGSSATRGRRAGKPNAAPLNEEGSSRAPGNSSSSCRVSAGRLRRRCATGSPRRLPTRNSRRSTGAGSGRTTESSTSTARSGGRRGRRDLPGRQLGRHAGVSEAELHIEARMGQEEVPGHVQTGGDGRAEGKSGGLEEDGAEDG